MDSSSSSTASRNDPSIDQKEGGGFNFWFHLKRFIKDGPGSGRVIPLPAVTPQFSQQMGTPSNIQVHTILIIHLYEFPLINFLAYVFYIVIHFKPHIF
uniref:Ovule protein n=1 Tax=Heterorhabditis bacteriophora TaxID=37862 RepID=A0A1I7XEH8_HETBA